MHSTLQFESWTNFPKMIVLERSWARKVVLGTLRLLGPNLVPEYWDARR